MKITKTLGKENFDKLFFGKQIPAQYTLNGKDFDTRFWVDDCRFLFVKNDQDGLIYCYAQPDITKPAVLISKATEEKALNIFKGTQTFVASINMSSATTDLKNTLFEMQDQPDFMKMFVSATKAAVAKSQSGVVASVSGSSSTGVATVSASGTTVKNEDDYVDLINGMIAEGMEMKQEIAELKAKNEELSLERDSLAQKLIDMKNALEDEQELFGITNGKHQIEIESLLEEASLYIEQRDEYASQLAEAYKNYEVLGLDYEELEKTKAELEKEYKFLESEFKTLYKDFSRMKKSSSRNSTYFNHALDEIERLNKHIEMQQLVFNMIYGAAEEEKGFIVHRLREENNANKRNSEKFANDQREMYRKSILGVLKDKSIIQQRLGTTLEAFEQLFKDYQDLLAKNNIEKNQLLEVMEELLKLEEQNKSLSEENKMAKELIFKKAEEIVKYTNKNKEKMYKMTAKAENNKEKTIYLAVGPHWEESQRVAGKAGKDYNTLYVIEGGDPSGVQDKDGVVMNLEDILTDASLREIYNIRAVKRIKVDKECNAKIEYYDMTTEKRLVQRTETGLKWFADKDVLKSNFVIEAKDVDAESLKVWVAENYDADANKVRVVAPTFKSQKILKYASIFAGAALVAGTLTFESVRAWGGPNEAEKAQNFGKAQIEAFVENLNVDENESLFQYAPAIDEYGNVLSYTKIVNGAEVAVEGNKVHAIGSANKVFYNNADNKVIIKTHTQESFWGKLRNYKEDTLMGAAYQLGAEVVEELSENNVPVYSFDENSSKKPLYVYLNFASENKDYSDRKAMLEYLKENGYSENLAEKITAEYEKGFAGGLENGLSNKVNEIIGTTDVVKPEPPTISFSDQTTKNAIADKITKTTLHGKQYTADELHVIYSDLDTDGEQVVFVAANKDGATGVNTNKYLYKIVLGDGSNEINAENINRTISNAAEVSENVKLEFMFKDSSFVSSVNRFYSKIAEGSVAYVSDYSLGQTQNGYFVEPTLTIYNAEKDIIEEQTSKYVVTVDASKNSSITEMCALALLGDYGYFDQKGIYSVVPTAQSTAKKTYNDNDKELN